MRILAESDVTTTLMDDGGLVLLAGRSGMLYRGNATATAMWTALNHHDGRVEAAAEAVAAQHQVDPSRVRADFTSFVSRLRRARLVRSEP